MNNEAKAEMVPLDCPTCGQFHPGDVLEKSRGLCPDNLPATPVQSGSPDCPYTIKVKGSRGGKEGPGWYGSLYLGKKRIAVIEDRGDGGPVDVAPAKKGEYRTTPDMKAFFEWVKALPPVVSESVYADGRKTVLPMDAELWLGLEADRLLALAQVKRLCKRNVVFELAGDPKGTLQMFKLGKGHDEAALIAEVRRRYGDAVTVIHNEALK